MDPRILALVPFLVACAAAPVSIDVVADDLAANDVVFLGEEHDNACGHAQQLELLQLLHAQRPNLVLSMEMFERDVQPMLDDYLSGRMDEETFLEGARPWPRYREHYRPLVEYCRAHELPVIAANLPRELSIQAAREGVEAVLGEEYAPRSSSAPRDDYWRHFQEAMSDHAGVEVSEAMVRFYEAQCLKDDTMAESIADALQAAPEGERPLVVHVNGNFHSDYRLGTVARLRERMPDLRIAVVSMEAVPNALPGGDIANWVLRVPQPPEEEDEETAAKPDPEATTTVAPTHGGGRPALGFMPAYGDDVVGAQIDQLVEGGAAERAGLQEGDIITQIGDRPIDDLQAYMSALSDLTVGQTVRVTVDRAGEQKTFDVIVGSRQ